MYLIDTFDVGFDYRDYQPWTINSLEIRLEAIRELLLPSNPNLITTEAIFQELIFICNAPAPVLSIDSSIHQGVFEKASNAFYKAKKYFLETNQNQYSWLEATCTWLNNACDSINERRHDDILTYHVWNRGTSSSCSIIITCIATVSDGENVIKLSISSPVNGEIIRVPLGEYSKAQNYMIEFQTKFNTELNNLLILICKQRKAIQ
jgi:hypothetical protein